MREMYHCAREDVLRDNLKTFCLTVSLSLYFILVMPSNARISRNKYTLHLTALSFYHHASGTPSLPIAATSEIYAQLHPSPEALAENIDHIMTICVMLREEQGDIIRELKKLGASTGFDVDLEDGGTGGDGSDTRDDWKEKVQALDELMEKIKSLEETVERMKMGSANEGKAKDHAPAIQEVLGGRANVVSEDHQGEEELGVLKEPRRRKQSDDIVTSGFLLQPLLASRRQEKKANRTPPPVYKRKRKSTNESAIATAAGKQVHVDQSSTVAGNPRPRSQSQSRRKSKKEVPNSQSADEAEASVEEIPGPLFRASVNNDECEEGEEEGEEEDEIEEDRIKSPAEKRRKGIAVSIVSKKEVAGRRVSQVRKGHK